MPDALSTAPRSMDRMRSRMRASTAALKATASSAETPDSGGVPASAALTLSMGPSGTHRTDSLRNARVETSAQRRPRRNGSALVTTPARQREVSVVAELGVAVDIAQNTAAGASEELK
jgi:hypothetical protein